MAVVDIDDLLALPTEAQLKEQLYSYASALGLPVTSWLSGAPTRTIIAIMAKMLAAIGAVISTIVKSGFLGEAAGGWLTLLALKVYGVTRIVATYASGVVTLTNSSGNLYSLDPGDLIVGSSVTEATYVNTAAIVLNPGASLTGVAIQAQGLGTDFNASIGQIDTLVTPLTGVTVTNPAALAATDEETDEALEARCLLELGALSAAGPGDAYRYVALTPELNGGVSIRDARALTPPGDGTITIAVASPAGAVSAPDVALVQAGVDEWATPLTVTATVQSATAVALTPTATVHVSTAAGLLDSEWEDLIKDALVAYVSGLPIGGLVLPPATSGVVPWRALIGIIENVLVSESDPTRYVLQATLSAESDTALTSTQVATLDPGDITLTITQVGA